MKLRDLYSKPIERTVNPAVSATKFDAETERTEIEEYVFTDEIINGLFRILDAIMNNRPYSHIGIWIDGYYGSGKSHFLKYLDYCITPGTRDAALQRLLDAVTDIDPMDERHSLEFGREQLMSIAGWLKRAVIDTCIFNLETSYDSSTDKKKAFLHVFWNEFNGKRGFNRFNITLAQNLEKPLAEKGVFEEFKARIAGEGGDWDDPGMAADLIDNELDLVLKIAGDLAPSLSVDSIRERIIRRDTAMSIDRFAMEVAGYLKDKGDDYRLVFLADEVSQFINKERDRYLNLQEIITKLSETCGNKVWVACTAQQDLSEIMDDCHIAEEKDNEGKIKGRFEVKVSLKGTQPEVITQKRILDKKEEVKPFLEAFYDSQETAFDFQFKLPVSYDNYVSRESFVDYYPFVPYQFKLIMQVFNSFLNLGYVAKEVKGNERSIIKVVHSTAKANAGAETGKIISFDELYNSMFEEGLQARGQRAVDNAVRMARAYGRNPGLAVRVANVLFMICNISPTDRLVFPATIDNVTSLLINDMKTSRLTLKDEVRRVVEFLSDNNIIRCEQGEQVSSDTARYSFYNEDEYNVARLIRQTAVDYNAQSDQIRTIFCKYITALKNKEQYMTRSFSVGMNIRQRSFLHTSNPDVVVELVIDNDYDSAELMAHQNESRRMIYYAGPLIHDNKRLYNDFYWYCQVCLYMATPEAKNGNMKIHDEFRKRAGELFNLAIVPGMRKIFDTCPIISGMTVIDSAILGSKSGNDRYRAAIAWHLSGIYTKAGLVNGSGMPRNTEQLKNAMLRPVQPGEYGGLNGLTDAEHEVEVYLNRQFAEANVADVLAKFAKAPYGWDNICTLYVINELVRRRLRDYSYDNDPNVDIRLAASRIAGEYGKFTLHQAKAIPPRVIRDFIDAWKDIFGLSSAPVVSDDMQLFRHCRGSEKENGNGNDRSLYGLIRHYKDIGRKIAGYPFVKPVLDITGLFGEWRAERDPLKFFNAVIEGRRNARELLDRCKDVERFISDQLPVYKDLLRFVEDNRDNFPFLPQDMQEAAGKMLKIKDDAWPVTDFRAYVRLQLRISDALNGVREAMREKIRAAYDEQFGYLKQAAEKQGVPLSVLAGREETIRRMTSPDNILVLRDNLNDDAFYQEQIRRIMSYNPRKEKKILPASLDTRTRLPISTEEDIDRYLEGLRRQLRKLMEGYDGVMITK